MAKKQLGKNTRASRRGLTEPDIEVNVPKEREDPKTRVLTQLTEKQVRDAGAAKTQEGGIDRELTAISMGSHSPKTGQVAKRKHHKKDKKKLERAEMLRDILNEKIDSAKERHKTVKTYRKPEEDEI